MNRITTIIRNAAIKLSTAILIMVGVAYIPEANAQELLDKRAAKEALKEITSGYSDWSSAGWQGAVKTDMLPLTPKMRVYMEKNKQILISVRASIFGEVARVEIDCDSVLVVNKFKKVYWSAPLSKMNERVSDMLNTMQSLLLGRVAVGGRGELSAKMTDDVQIFSMPDGSGWLIVPDIKDEEISLNYGFAVAADTKRITNAMAAYGKTNNDEKDNKSFSLSADVTYDAAGNADAAISLASPKLNMAVTLEADEVKYDCSKMDRIQLSKSYRRGSLRDCMKF